MRSSAPHYRAAGALLCCAALSSAALSPAAAANEQPRPAVVELFTSEGCSSCPPAEAYLGELAQRREVLALAYHVDYWDDLGWRDRFGLPEAVQRQRAYAKALGLSTVYTPQAVIDGQENLVGSDRRSIAKALEKKRSGVPIALSARDGEVVVDLSEQANAAPSDVVLIAFQRSASSRIGRGENAGRTLEEYNVVRDLRRLGRWDGEKRQYRFPARSLPPEATDVALLVQPLGQAPIIGAATLALR
ncbi:MAG: DUF1223 domain-containing protein [Steroidobacteraceae bacterium]